MKMNPLNQIDFYKSGHLYQYPEGTEYVYSNFTPRSDKYAREQGKVAKDFDGKIVFVGLQGFIKWFLIDIWNQEFFLKPKEEVVSEYRRRMDTALGEGAVGTEHIEALHDLGYLPIRIKALPEGSRVPMKVPVLSIINTKPEFYWLTNYLETVLSAELWKTSTNATIAYEFRRILERYAEETGTFKEFVHWQAHDFSMRGMSGVYDAAQSGIGHLLSFYGTDTIPAIDYLENYYNGKETFVGGSVAASEHSVMTIDGPDGELELFRRLITNIYPSGIVSLVSDGFDFFRVITEYATTLKPEILARTPNELGMAKVVFRPDCYDDQTEVLTNSGWKFFKDLTEQDLVAQVHESGEYEFVKPEKYIDQDYSGKMIRFSDHFGKVDLVVTPNHRMAFKMAKTEKIKIQEAAECTTYFGKDIIRSGFAKDTGRKLTALERFKIAFQADGSFPSKIPANEGVISGFRTFRFNFRKQRKIDRLISILEEGGWKFTVDYYDSRQGQATIYVWLPLEIEVSKNLDWINLDENTCSSWCKDAILEISQWDSHIRHERRIKFDSTELGVAEKVRDIALFAGYGALLSQYTDEREDHFSDVFTVHIMMDNLFDGQSIKKDEIEYTGKVYCVKVPTGLLMVKRNRGTAVCGNSGDPVEILCGAEIQDISKAATLENAKHWAKDTLVCAVRDNTPHGECGEDETKGLFRFEGKVYEAKIEIEWNRYDKQYYFEDGSNLISFEEVTLTPEQKGAVECLWDIFGGTVTDKGYKVLNERVGLIYGDSITIERMEEILRRLKDKGFASCNSVFGIGSYTYQCSTRDTFGFAMKATWGRVNGVDRAIFKDPVTDSGTKKSAKGFLQVLENSDGEYTLKDNVSFVEETQGSLQEVFYNGMLTKDESLATIRARLLGSN